MTIQPEVLNARVSHFETADEGAQWLSGRVLD